MADTRKDLVPIELGELAWGGGQDADTLKKIFEHATGSARQAILWYLDRKGQKKHAAKYLRIGAILAAAVAGILPILSQLYTANGQSVIQPAWASVALALGATCVLIDRFFGCSTGWMRCIATELRLSQSLYEFQIDWEIERTRWRDGKPSPEEIQMMLTRAKAFVVQLNTIVQDETNSWIDEFQTTLKQLDDATRAKAITTELGGLNVVVTNGDRAEGEWHISIDGGTERNCRGKSTAIAGLLPGMHTIRIVGQIDGKHGQDERLAAVPPGAVTTVELTLI
jgi:hypothetical protein